MLRHAKSLDGADTVMVINMPRDDLGTISLKEANAARATAPVASLSATARTGAQSSPSRSIPIGAQEERRHGERRQGRHRRGQGRHAAVLFDTRSHYERRTHERRHQSADQGLQYPPLGIDVHI